MKKFELLISDGAGALASGATVAVSVGDIAVAGAVLAAGDMAGAVPSAGDMAGAVVVPGAAATEAPGAAASAAVERAGEVAGGLIAGLVAGGGAGLCAKLASAAVMEQRLTISVFFIFI